MFSNKFICAGTMYSTYEKHVPSPYFKKIFDIEKTVKRAGITVCGLGFYRMYLNGQDITKGLLAPYLSNPNHYVYHDSYHVGRLLKAGKNVLVFQLGNGVTNAQGGILWNFDIASFRDVPKLSFAVKITYEDGTVARFEADGSVLTHPSPIWFDDFRSGEFYDARLECDDLHAPSFGADWKPALPAKAPIGQARICRVAPITEERRIKPVNITKTHLADYKMSFWNQPPYHRLHAAKPAYVPTCRDGYLYDFGENTAGIVELRIKGTKGQRIELQFCEYVDANGDASYANIDFFPDGYSQRDIYICKGDGEEVYKPRFTYHGFRYCVVMGITDEQATEQLLTAIVCHSDVGVRAGFTCSDKTANTLQEMVLRTDLANFYYFPTDCPHREKNGWTGDSATSCEQMLLNLDASDSIAEWLHNIYKAQDAMGRIPGIIPTETWGYVGLNGPAWDRAIVELPYQVYRFSGNKEICREAIPVIDRYLRYLSSMRLMTGLVDFGLGDWLQPGHDAAKPTAPVAVTNSIISMDICHTAMKLYRVCDVEETDERYRTAETLYHALRAAIRLHQLDKSTMTVLSDCQTAQAMGIYYGLFEPDELDAAVRRLIEIVRRADCHMDAGLLGLRVLFHVLTDNGYVNEAFKMITRHDFPSYGYLIDAGLTTLPESFQEDYKTKPMSLDHHFFGDISSWFISRIGGIRVNPKYCDIRNINVAPHFPDALDFAEAHYDSVSGRITTRWERQDGGISLSITVPAGIHGAIYLPAGYAFRDGSRSAYLMSGTYQVRKL